MKKDFEGAKFNYNNILGKERIAEIKRILIEYNPKGLCDGTSFDTYVEYIPVGAKAGEKGGIGIEVKYTEKEYQIKRGSKEWLETHNESGVHLADNYRIPSCQCGWFKTEYINDVSFDNQKQMASHVTANLYRQIWRNHILGASMMLGMCPDEEDKLTELTSHTVYPKENSHFSKVFKDYESSLTDSVCTTVKRESY